MSEERPIAYAASRMPLYPSDASLWDVHNGSVVSPTAHVGKLAERVVEIYNDALQDAMASVNASYEEVRSSTSALAGRMLAAEETLDSLRGAVLSEVDPEFVKWLAGRTFVEVVPGKGLSSNDFTAELKGKLSGISDGAEKNVIVGVKLNGTDLVVGSDRKVNVAALTQSTADGLYVKTNDSRLTNARTPTAHRDSHISGADKISATDIGALAASDNGSTISHSTGPGGPAIVASSLYSSGVYGDGIYAVTDDEAGPLADIGQYGGNFKNARQEVNDIVSAAVSVKQASLNASQLEVVNAGVQTSIAQGGTGLVPSGVIFDNISAVAQAVALKQPKLTAGANITITNNVISAAGGEVTKDAVVGTGVKATDLGGVSSTDSRLSLASYPIASTTGALADRTVNDLGNVTSDVVVIPPAARSDGYARDFIVTANVTGTKLVTFRTTDSSGASVTYRSQDPQSIAPEEGHNTWYVTENGGALNVAKILAKPMGHLVKFDLTVSGYVTGGQYPVIVELKDADGEKIDKVTLKGGDVVSKIYSGVSTMVIDVGYEGEGYIVINGTKYMADTTLTLTGDMSVTNAYTWQGCLTPESPITVPGGVKLLRDIRVGDVVLGVDPETGTVCETKVVECDTADEKYADSRDEWMFVGRRGGNRVVTTVRRHRFYNVERGAMTYMDEWKTGEHGRTQDGDILELVDHVHVEGESRHMTLFTETQTYFVNGMLSGNRHTEKINWKDGE